MNRFYHIRQYLLFTSMLMFSCVAMAQENICFSPRLKTLQVQVGGVWGNAPVMLLSPGHYVDISFDDLQGDYQRYVYTITHCNADWTPSDILTSEYMTGFSHNNLEDYEPAISTEMKYNHYNLRLPNEQTRLLISGNYKVEFFEDGEDEPVAQACFSVIEPRVGVAIDATSNTDIDTYATHQQVSFEVNYSGYELSNPVSELKYVVTQNHRWDSHVMGLQPSLMQVNKLIFNHNRKLIFPAGNEYRRFEILDPYVPTLHVDEMAFDDTYYHAFLYPDEQRVNYFYDEDQDGRFYIRNNDNVENDTESDYFFTHFSLQMPEVPGGHVYLYGDLTQRRIDEAYQLEYNLVDHQYEIMIPLKQGIYNYMYMYVSDDDENATPLTQPCEGNFHQAENEYEVYVYHRPFGLRYDKLIGFQKLKYKE